MPDQPAGPTPTPPPGDDRAPEERGPMGQGEPPAANPPDAPPPVRLFLGCPRSNSAEDLRAFAAAVVAKIRGTPPPAS